MSMLAIANWDGLFSDFAWPWILLALPLPWLAHLLLPVRRQRSDALKVPYGRHLEVIEEQQRRGAAATGNGWIWAAWVLLCLAAARPQQLGEPVEPPQRGRQMMLAVDLSGSMSEPDMELGGRVMDRLTAAKAVLSDFLARRAGDRIGLLVFGDRAYVLTPLTLDHDSVRDQLRDSVVQLAGRETAMGDAIGLVVKRLREQPEGDRVLILLTDGVNNAGSLDPLKAAEIAKAEHVRVYTIGFGGNRGMALFGIRLPVTGRDNIDEPTLRQIADQTGGRFFRAGNTKELVAIYAELNRLEPVDMKGASIRPRIECYPVPLAMAAGLALLGFLWPKRDGA
ncbi:MAG: VWA domain-containing protein [Xanthomonadaceae bacterium]|jgi:Ca-activated chloride channel family protein|nr:VWA domain-containing protein [Xanthomonadaceae bacterium]